MISLAGYENFLQIHDSSNSQVYRARRVEDGQPVILKFLNREYPTPEQIRRYKQEYSLTHQLDAPGIIKAYRLEEWQRSYAIALEDFGGISLQQWLQEREPLSLKEFLAIAIAIAESLAQIHAQNIIHKDINPANLIVNPQTQELKIIDFGISTQLNRENPTLKNPNVLEGTLAYISPEQTGRMNRGLDYRTDFYSLGVTFYELLTGKRPFATEEPLELAHCHIAKTPRSPAEIKLSIPAIISQIVMKLMAKNAEDRYQSAYGLKVDLETCQQQLEKQGQIDFFALGRQDISERFHIPQKLYGREAEIATLLAAFERVAQTGNVELMLVSGYSGIGKSALVQELYKPITARRGYFIAGKFDQFQRNIPYSAIVSAFRGLMEQLLGENESKLQVWRNKLLQALGNNGQIIIDVIPEVELIIGKQPPVPVLGANETQNRFNLVIGNFIRVFCSQEHPLTLFLDDLQWSDLVTLKLMERLLIESQTRYLLLLGTYRDNEVSKSHPLMLALEKLRQKNAAINQITLLRLSIEEILCLVGDTLQQTPENSGDLAELIEQKTGGNPFFVNKFLQALHDEKLVTFCPKKRGWQWNIERIEAREFTDNVVELMLDELKKLPQSSQNILSLAACLGAKFNLKLLTWIEKDFPQKIFASLKIALDRHLIFPLSELDENLLIQSYQFAHDRIQQAAYTLILEAERAEKHVEIGRILLANTLESERDEKIFDIVDQFNQGMDIVRNEKEREQFARLNWQAGCKAKDATAYAAAIAYFNAGMSLLKENPWQTQYELTLSLYQEAAKAAYLNAEIERMEKLVEIVAKEAKTHRDRLEVEKIKLDAYSNQERFSEALNAGLESLAALDIEFPQDPSPEDLAIAIAATQNLIGDREPMALLNLPVMQDPLLYEILTLLVKIAPVTYQLRPPLFPLMVCKQIELSITYGNAPVSAFSYATYGMVLSSTLQEFALAYEYARLALKILSHFNERKFEAAVLNVIYGHLSHWTVHAKGAIEPLRQACRVGLETGDLAYAGYVTNHASFFLFLTGCELSEAVRDIERHNEILAAIGQKTALNYTRPCWQAMLNLQGYSEHPHRLVGKAMNEESLIAYYQKANNKYGQWLVYVPKAILCYLFEEFEEALTASTSAQIFLTDATIHLLTPVWCFYNSLIQLSAIDEGKNCNNNEREAFLSGVQKNQKRMKCWADSAPMNYLHKFYLVEAEYYRAIGEKVKAIEFYNLAIAKAKENEYIQEEALANELTAKFYLDWSFNSAQCSTERSRSSNGQEIAARAYMMNAHYCYSRWGAIAKVKHLEEKYSQLYQSSSVSTSTPIGLNPHATREATDSQILDLATVIKSTNAISSEIILESLLAALMNSLIENAGAERGILLLSRGDRLNVEATKESEFAEVSASESIPLEDFSLISARIVHYVARTRETVFLHNATKEGNFTDDPYIRRNQCRSIACIPLINQSKLKGIIYLENNLTTGVFTRDRLQLLQMLAAQAAISLENARLYENLQTLNLAYERFIPSQFLSFLEKKSIVDVTLGDQVEREMTVLFSDIRDFTTISEQMTPAENFAFINGYLGRMEPLIQQYGGFIDKYIGDAIMALFGNTPDDALKAAIAMLEELQVYNLSRLEVDRIPLRIGIGLHTGRLMLGTVGGADRMDGTAIGDSVNLSSRVEGLTKTYGISLLITQQTFLGLKNPFEYDFRFIERVTAKGKAKAVSLFEVFSADSPDLREAKNVSKGLFEKGTMLFHQRAFSEAAELFQQCLEYHQGDRAARSYLERCQL
ncbi:MAG: AAA family ATPase [Cyanobacteria bacterium SBLK]|nr:AAA family ATPase [Cyanobacteria bacterium SBLK]